jgi:nitrite transporter NirC
MPYDDVQKFSEAAVNKARLLKEHPGKYFLRAVMAGFFIVVAMIFSNVVGNTFQSTDPAWGKLLGGIVFAIAVLLIVFIGAELFTGNNLVMAFGAYDKKVSWAQVGKVWLVCRMPDSLRNFRTGRCFRYCRLLRRIYWK